MRIQWNRWKMEDGWYIICHLSILSFSFLYFFRFLFFFSSHHHQLYVNAQSLNYNTASIHSIALYVGKNKTCLFHYDKTPMLKNLNHFQFVELFHSCICSIFSLLGIEQLIELVFISNISRTIFTNRTKSTPHSEKKEEIK